MTASTYQCDPCACTLSPPTPFNNGSGICWHESLWRRLSWQYGESEANSIVLGLDGATERDKAAWEGLGG